MGQKVQAIKFDKTDKARLKTKGRTSRTGQSTARNRHHHHGRAARKS
jgi:hypothetical protein